MEVVDVFEVAVWDRMAPLYMFRTKAKPDSVSEPVGEAFKLKLAAADAHNAIALLSPTTACDTLGNGVNKADAVSYLTRVILTAFPHAEPAAGAAAGAGAAAPASGSLAAKLASIGALVQPDDVDDDAWKEHKKELVVAARKENSRGGRGGGAAGAGVAAGITLQKRISDQLEVEMATWHTLTSRIEFKARVGIPLTVVDNKEQYKIWPELEKRLPLMFFGFHPFGGATNIHCQ